MDICDKLVVISQIEVGDKLSIVDGCPQIMKPSRFRGWYRFYQGDSRHNTVNYINKLVESVMVDILENKTSDDMLLHTLLSAKIGIYHLIKTYCNDTKTTKKLEQIVLNIFMACELQKVD